ncbi:hypothetical protein SISNIDRAFT_418676 [Sistotremastrum niveocremeum HHB9708]|uniref:Kinase-like protein n=1 Tax=Sistotremastrum niveocremeum HHB9708 TaxID=1314777 RepID=A0A164NXC2_9AGAM|nr:hypothetical protein SISNIDRAFT_418676 [Sistotremastrum niveocremeum HHB9708]
MAAVASPQDTPPIVDGDVLLAAKENIQPLAAGRRVTSLATVLSTPRKELTTQRDSIRAQFRQELSTAFEEDDPLDIYHRFIQWTVENYPQGQSAESGLLELLEEATRVFKDDEMYKADLRYLKIWIMFAGLVERAEVVYKWLVVNEVGTGYSLLYEEYALLLEHLGRRPEADEIYNLGIARKARPLERLQNRHKAFQTRMMTSTALPPPSRSSTTIITSTSRRNVLGTVASGAAASPLSLTAGSRPNGRIQPFVDTDGPHSADGNEWQELGTRKSRVKENTRETTKMGETILKSKLGPTPLTPKIIPYRDEDDVMSVKKSTAEEEAIRRDPFRKWDAVDLKPKTNAMPPPQSTSKPALSESAKSSTSSTVSSAGKTRFTFPATDAKGKKHPYAHLLSQTVSTKPQKQMCDLSLLLSEDGTESCIAEVRLRGMGILGKVWDEPQASSSTIPADKSSKKIAPTVTINTKAALSDVFDMYNSPEKTRLLKEASIKEVSTPAPEKPTLGRKTSERTPGPMQVFVDDAEAKAAFMPFVDEPEPSKSAATKASFVPFVDDDASDARVSATPAPARTPFGRARIQEAETPMSDHPFESEEIGEDEEDEDEHHLRRIPMGGRFGQFNVMTPITERTNEFTTSTRAFSTPSGTLSMSDKAFLQMDAVESAELLAAELREEEAREKGLVVDVHAPLLGHSVLVKEGSPPSSSSAESIFTSHNRSSPPFKLSDGFTIPPVPVHPPPAPAAELSKAIDKPEPLNLRESINVTSQFKPPNPCNPFDPEILGTLLSLLPNDRAHHDLKHQEAKLLQSLQKFTAKKVRRGSYTVGMGDSDCLEIKLGEQGYRVFEKIGEGGFGAVFMAQEVDPNEEDRDLEDDFEEKSFALKVVRPRNVWEFYILRNILRSLPPPLRKSIIQPHGLYTFKDESFLILELSEQGTLLEVVNGAAGAGVAQHGGSGLEEVLVIFFAVELLRLVEGMHRLGLIHGDLKIDNCLVRLDEVEAPTIWESKYDPAGGNGWSAKGVKMIDFGRSVDMRMFPASQRFVGDWPTDVRDCLEVREARPWSYQTDYWGLASIFYCMLYGKYIETVVSAGRVKLAQPLKRYWQGEMWTRTFDLLLNSGSAREDGKLPLCEEIGGLRVEMEDWLVQNCTLPTRDLKALLKKVERGILNRVRR